MDVNDELAELDRYYRRTRRLAWIALGFGLFAVACGVAGLVLWFG